VSVFKLDTPGSASDFLSSEARHKRVGKAVIEDVVTLLVQPLRKVRDSRREPRPGPVRQPQKRKLENHAVQVILGNLLDPLRPILTIP
jgi:hypothetical protein